MRERNVFPNAPITKQRVSAALSAGWARCAATMGKGAFADKIEVTTRTIDNALTGTTVPELHTAFNSLLADPTALDEVAALYGVTITPRETQPDEDIRTAAGLAHLAGKLIEALEDGHRDHRETLSLAKDCRPLVKALSALVAEADAIKSGGVVQLPIEGRARA